MTRVGCYPGSFDPPTIAHIAIATAARDQCNLDVVDLVLSTVVLGKEDRHYRLAKRLAEVERCITPHAAWLRVVVTTHQLLADIADGYAVVILGADKWEQIQQPRWYGGSPSARDAALARLPVAAIAPRPPHPLPSPSEQTRILLLPDEREWHFVSSTAVRNGAEHFHAASPQTVERTTPTSEQPGDTHDC